MRSTIHNRQSLPDMAIQECGTFEAAFALAERNGLALTDNLTAGQELEIPPEQVTKKQVVVTLESQSVKPATAITAQDEKLAPYGGIGFMGIGIDFIVSR